MPYYDYECRNCGHEFETFQSMADDPLKDCPACKEPQLRRLIAGAGVIFKGSGFYVNDSRSSGSESKSSSSTSDSSTKSASTKSGDSKSGSSKSGGSDSGGSKKAAAAS